MIEGSSPFLFVNDSRGRAVRWALVTAPIVSRDHHAELARLSRGGYRFAGMPGYLSFPERDGCDVRDYGAICEAWFHPFRDPDRYLPAGAPRMLLSHSDFTDPQNVEAVARRGGGDTDHDFVYVGAEAAWKREAKNWELAALCVPRICEALGLRALVVGTPTHDFRPSDSIRFASRLEWPSFLARLRRARFLFVPNVLDASPRVLAEALCLDVPIVVSRGILGGWKYVNPFTGVFFDNERDVVDAVQRCLGSPRSPRRWFAANFGPYLTGVRLLRSLREVDPAIPERSHLLVTAQLEAVDELRAG